MPWLFKKKTPPRDTNHSTNKDDDSKKKREEEEENEGYMEEFGVTDRLLDYVSGFTINAFKDYPLLDDGRDGHANPSAESASSVSKDLTDWQERHAVLVLSRVKELSQLRYVLCPRHLKEKQFWRIYFLLVKTYTSPYEIRAVQKAKLRMMELENEKFVDKAAIEVEMADKKHTSGSLSKLQCDPEHFADEV